MRISKVTENTIDPYADINQSLKEVDGLIVGKVADLAAAPPAEPEDGERIAVTAGATGAFDEQDGKLAIYRALGAYWEFYDAAMCVYDGDIYVSNTTDWVAV